VPTTLSASTNKQTLIEVNDKYSTLQQLYNDGKVFTQYHVLKLTGMGK
jgi:hypothetical protein